MRIVPLLLALALVATLDARAARHETTPAPAWVVAGRVPAGRALVIVHNASGATLVGGSYTIHFDGRRVAKLRRLESSAVLVEPGPHQARVGSFRDVPFEARPGEVIHWVVAYSPAKSWALPIRGAGFGYGVVADSVGRPLLERNRWVEPLVPLPASDSAGVQ